MNIPWWLEIAISTVVILTICHIEYKNGYRDGYLDCAKATGEAIKAAIKLKETEEKK